MKTHRPIKLTLLFFSFVLFYNIGFSQGHNWGQWKIISSCYPNIKARVKLDSYNESAKKWHWKIEIQNNYNSRVRISYSFGKNNYGKSQYATEIEAGGIDRGLWTLHDNANEIDVALFSVCSYFENGIAKCSEKNINGYATFMDCNGKYIIQNGNSSQGNYNNSSTNNNGSLKDEWNALLQRKTNACKELANLYYHSDMNRYSKHCSNQEFVSFNGTQAQLDSYRKKVEDLEIEVENGKKQSGTNNPNSNSGNTLNNNSTYNPPPSLPQTTNNNNQTQYNKDQQLQQNIQELTKQTVDLATYFATRKNALRNSLSIEDGQALIDIANSENPTDYVQNIIQIFSDLGYTHRETQRKDGYTVITLNNDVANINDFMMIFVHPANYDYYNSISFSYHRNKKLREQLAVLGDKLEGSDNLNIKGISPSNRLKKIKEDEKKLNDKTKYAITLIADFEKNNYWNSSEASVFSYAKEIAEAYEDKNALNNKSEAIRYYRKAASFTLDELALPYNGDKSMREFIKNELLVKVYFRLAFLLDDDENNNGKEAISWYQKSSNAGYSKSSSNMNIARLYKGGLQGVEKDWSMAKTHFEIAAEEKNGEAMYRLGLLYKTGGFNLDKDESKSKKWLKKACKANKKYCN